MADDVRNRRSPSPDEVPTSKRARLSGSHPPSSLSTRPASNGHAGYMGSSGGMSAPLKPLSLSILGVEPLDEFIREIADWIHGLIMNRNPNLQGEVEVEAKLGLLKPRNMDTRVDYPVRVETIMAPDDFRFESNMTAAQHKHFNTRLNELEATSRQPNHPTSPLRYHHSFLIDTFYSPEGHDGGDKIRVTRDEKTGEVKECLRKIRLGNLDVYSPKWNADWRVSVNIEVPVPPPVGTANFSRRKDRMSYSHEEFVIDLTQVTQTTGSNQKIMHELEIEFARPAVLLSTAAVRGDSSVSQAEQDAFDELVRAFVNNVRILVRNTRPA